MALELTADIGTWPVFAFLPPCERVVFQDFADEKIQCYEIVRKGESELVLVMEVIRREEKFYWESCRELLERSTHAAAAAVSGVFRFDVLNFDPRREINAFRDQELAQLLVNHARLLAPGGERFVKYSSCFGILKKMIHEDWGKMVLRSGVEVFAKEPAQLDLLVRRLLRAAGARPGAKTVVIYDLSPEPIFNRSNDLQQKRLAKLFGAQINLFERPPAVYINDGEAFVDLTAQW